MDTHSNLLSEALDERWEKYRSELKNGKQEFSEEVVHDLRVAARRLLAVMDILRQLDPQPPMKKIRRLIKGQVDALDDLRDTQVMLAKVSESLQSVPDLQTFEEHLQSREKKLLRKTYKDLESSKPADLKKRISKIQIALEEHSDEEDWTARLLSVLDQAYASARQAFGQIDAANPTSIHAFRVRFKKFRYMLEVILPVLKNYPQECLEQMHDYQSRMGDVQDANVFLNTLNDFDANNELTAVREAFEKQRAERIDTFMARRSELNEFWRAAPEQKFPWEQNL